jgi:holin-like protein
LLPLRATDGQHKRCAPWFKIRSRTSFGTPRFNCGTSANLVEYFFIAQDRTEGDNLMIAHFAVFLGFQLIGEVIARALGLSLPGPVIGMALLTVVLMARPQFGDDIASTANGFLAHLSLLYVPAGVGIAQYVDQFDRIGAPLMAALIVSTVLAIGAGALTFKYVNALLGVPDETPE